MNSTITFEKLNHAKILGLSVFLFSSIALAQKQQKLEIAPTPPRPESRENDVIEQAGVGGNMAYARAGVLEIGGSASLTVAKNFTEFGLAPSIGWFIADNILLTSSLNWKVSKVTGSRATHLGVLLGEPSYNYPFTNTEFGFIGLGLGFATQTGANVGLAVAPRIGYKVMVGRSGLLTFDLRNIFVSNDVIDTPEGTVLTVSNAFSLGAGFTVLW